MLKNEPFQRLSRVVPQGVPNSVFGTQKSEYVKLIWGSAMESSANAVIRTFFTSIFINSNLASDAITICPKQNSAASVASTQMSKKEIDCHQ